MLLAFEKKLNSVNSLVLSNMKKSRLTEIDIQTIFINIGLVANQEIITFYLWKNGYKEDSILDSRCEFIPYGIFFDLNTMLELYNIMQENNFVKNFFFPLSHDQPYLINLDAKSKYYGYIYFYSPSSLILEPTRMFDSLTHMFNTISICFDEKILYYDKQGYLEIDWILYEKTCKVHNPNSEYWDN